MTLVDHTLTSDIRTGFTGELRTRYDHLFEAFWRHPFLDGLRDGTLSREATLHYVGQDHHYLTAYLRCYGLGASISPDREWIQHFVESSNWLLHDETHPHHVMCDAFEVDYAEVQHDRLAPSAQAYIDHMMEAARDTLGVLSFALLPCPWTYIWAGERHLAGIDLEESKRSNPFHEWWAFYGAPEQLALLDDFIDRCERLAAAAGPAERERMVRAFELSCYHEIRFWQMAFTQETWDDLPNAILGR